MRYLCQVVPFLLVAPLSACYASHVAPGDDAGRPPVRRDASRPRPPPPPPPTRDAGPPPRADAGTVDCPLARADFTCLSSFIVEPGRAFELPIAFDGCFCCSEAQCAVRVDSASRRLELTTARCPDPCDCDVCQAGPSTGCQVPALDPGFWTVVVNGEEAFDLPVQFDSGLLPPPPTCVSYAEGDACGEDPSIASATDFARLCVESQPDPSDPPTLRLDSLCARCGDLDGTCSVLLEPRLTDDLPRGGELRVTGTSFSTRCDIACASYCIEHSRRCAIPELRAGDLYRVWLGGHEVYSFIGGERSSACVDLVRDLSPSAP